MLNLTNITLPSMGQPGQAVTVDLNAVCNQYAGTGLDVKSGIALGFLIAGLGSLLLYAALREWRARPFDGPMKALLLLGSAFALMGCLIVFKIAGVLYVLS
jgi:hypothetical protein